MPRYRPRATDEVEAVRWLGEQNCEEVFAFLGLEHSEEEMDHTVIHLDYGDAHHGDWIIRLPEGSYYDYDVLSEEEFAVEYEAVATAPVPAPVETWVLARWSGDLDRWIFHPDSGPDRESAFKTFQHVSQWPENGWRLLRATETFAHEED